VVGLNSKNVSWFHAIAILAAIAASFLLLLGLLMLSF
jgi:hypothetical protein